MAKGVSEFPFKAALQVEDFPPPQVPEIRTQVDGRQEEFSFKAGTRKPEGERDLARQEFKDETDTGKLMARYGAGMAFGPPAQGGFRDFTVDLQKAYEVVEESRSAWFKLPADVRAKYANWEALLGAIERKEYPPPADAVAGAAAGGGAASDSAADAKPGL